MAQIIISEKQEQVMFNQLMESLITESGDYSDKVLRLKKELDDNFIRVSQPEEHNGKSVKGEYVVKLNVNKQPEAKMSDLQVFYWLQERFKDILPIEERDKFLKKVLVKWYQRKITRNGSLMP